MLHFKISVLRLVLPVLMMAAIVSCDRFEGSETMPSWLKIDAINVVDNPGNSWSQEPGFFSSQIDAVQVDIWVSGDTAETNLGTFQLPCKIPVLRKGLIDRVRVTPVVKQDGIAGKRIYYPYYDYITFDSVRFQTDSVTDLGTLQTHYVSQTLMRVAWQEFFEPGPSEISIDTSMVRVFATDTVCSGYSCGAVRIKPNQTNVSFWADTTFTVTDPQAIIYLEMDYWSDFDFSVGLNNPKYDGGPNVITSHMTIYGKPEKGWQKIYVNIGALWSKEYYHYKYIRPFFTIFNPDGKSGNLYIDNLKVVVL